MATPLPVPVSTGSLYLLPTLESIHSIKRVAFSRETIDCGQLLPLLRSLPSLRQITVELSHPRPQEITESVRLVS